MSSNDFQEKYGIAQFAGKDFSTWKFRGECLLEAQNLLPSIQRTQLDENDQTEAQFENFLIKFDGMIRELKSMGANIDKITVISHLLLTLAQSFGPIVTTSNALDEGVANLAFVKRKLLDFFLKRSEQSKTENNEGMLAFQAQHNHQNNYQN